MLTDKARNIKSRVKIGDNINVKWLDGEIVYSQKAKVFNVSDVFFTTDKSTAIYYNEVLEIQIQNELFGGVIGGK